MPDSDQQSIGPYRILELIDRGAQATVFKAVYEGDENDWLPAGTEVALKLLHGEDPYFERQAAFHETLLHPNIVRYLGHFRDEGDDEQPYIIMELLDGYNLKQLIVEKGEEGALDWSVVKDLFDQCLEGLIFASKQHVVHRDIKPSNIFQCADGVAKIIDFGVARRLNKDASSTAGFRGTMDYMAPDFVTEDGFSGDEASDIYSLGVCFFEALVGELPFDALGSNAEFEWVNRWKDGGLKVFSPSQWVRAHRKKQRAQAERLEGLRLTLSGFSDFLKRSLSPDRARRFASFVDMQEALRAINYAQIRSPQRCYELTGLLGVGGFGRVYRARAADDPAQRFAIKHLLSSNNAARFRREAELMQQFPHPHIVSCIELIEKERHGDEDLWLVMELLPGMPGGSLRDRLKAQSGEGDGMPVPEALSLFAGLLAGLNHLHENGILHRDIKPANLFAPEGEPQLGKLLDLGIARDPGSTMTKGGAPGTLDYMAPEFAIESDFKGSPASDVYALGLCLYEALNAEPAFPRLSASAEPAEVAFFHRAKSMPRPMYTAGVWTAFPNLKKLVQRAIEPKVSRRYQRAGEMLEDIRKLVDDPANTIVLPPGFHTTLSGHLDSAAPTPIPLEKEKPRHRTERLPHGSEMRFAQNFGQQGSVSYAADPGARKTILSLVAILVMALILLGVAIRFMQRNQANRCVEQLGDLYAAIAAFEQAPRVDEPLLQRVQRMRLDLELATVDCDELDWTETRARLADFTKGIPLRLNAAMVDALIAGEDQAINVQRGLWQKLKAYGGLDLYGLSYDEWSRGALAMNASELYHLRIKELAAANLDTRTTLTVADVSSIDALYASSIHFLNADWSAVYGRVLAEGATTRDSIESFVARVDALFIDYIVGLGTAAVEKNQRGESVIAEFQAITDPKLTTSTVGRASPAFRTQRDKIEKLIKGLLAGGDNF